MSITREEVDGIIRYEVERADEKYGNFTSSHEGLGVMLEEFDELREAVRHNAPESIRLEAMQVAAVATRLAYAMSNESTLRRSGRVPK